MAEPMQINDKEIFCHISVGVATFPDNGANTDELIHYADTQMYLDKKRYKDRE